MSGRPKQNRNTPMTVAAAFKSLYPSNIADYFASREATVDVWQAQVDAFKETIGGREVIGTSFFDGGFSVTGYRAVNSSDELPAGWRRTAKREVVPALRTPEGKAAAETLAGLTLHGDKYPGCPSALVAEGFITFPRVAKVGEDYYLTLSRIPLDEPANTIDAELWEPVPLSAYYAALETEPAAAL